MSVGLVLEGGGMRGAYTAGVLDEFMKHEIYFPAVYAVSAGACCALSYLSGQYERNKNIFYNYVSDKRYVSVHNLRKNGSLFGFDFIFGTLFYDLVPFDAHAFRSSKIHLMVGATDLKTGRAAYFGKEEMDEHFLPVQASSSLPFLSNIIKINNRPYLDGGISAPIPYERSLLDGNGKNVVVLTRDRSFRKRSAPSYPHSFINVRYREYPAFVRALLSQSDLYNGELDFISRQEQAGTMVVIRPSQPIDISRYEKNQETLMRLYQMGRQDTQAKLTEIQKLLKSD
ncbi:MAG TPA: patatin family protein [Ruminococcaceae bacterium]|jgi:predicted patatin/cPLA2 family phospholipase|nr:patatin family protein [Oscillospiraceae bacterium]